MTTIANSPIRPAAKFFFEGDRKFFVKGVTYGPFKPDAEGNYLGRPEQVDIDLARMRQAGLNVVRIYHTPPRWFLDRCAAAASVGKTYRIPARTIDKETNCRKRSRCCKGARGTSRDLWLPGRQRNFQHNGALARRASRDRICGAINSHRTWNRSRCAFLLCHVSANGISAAAECRFLLFQCLSPQPARFRGLPAAAAKSLWRASTYPRGIRHGHDPAFGGRANG